MTCGLGSSRKASEMGTIDEQRHSYQVRIRLEEFWKRAEQARTRLGRLNLLRQMASVVLGPDPYQPINPKRMRRHFEKMKARGRYRLKGWCWVCQKETPDHRHHIIPIGHGGRNRQLNIVNVCICCHEAIHGFVIY